MIRILLLGGWLILSGVALARDLDGFGSRRLEIDVASTNKSLAPTPTRAISARVKVDLVKALLSTKKTGWNGPRQTVKAPVGEMPKNRATATNEHSLVVSIARGEVLDEKGNPVGVGSSGRVEIIASGLHYPDGKGGFLETVEAFEPTTDGFQASRGVHRAFVSGKLDEKPAFRVDDNAGGVFEGRILGLGYHDPDSGKSVLIAPVQATRSSLISSNTVEFSSCFRGINASLRYIYRKSGFAQDLVLNGPIPSPLAYGLSDQAVIEVWTELSGDSSVPSVSDKAVIGKSASRKSSAAEEAALVEDQSLHFGRLKMAQGAAFRLNSTNAASSLPVGKRLMEQDGRRILIESLPWKSFDKANGDKTRASLPNGSTNKTAMAMNSSRRPFPARQDILPDTGNGLLLADGATASQEPFIIDFEIITGSLNNYTFRSDTTYRIEGPTYLNGTTVFEAGAVIKYVGPGTYASLVVNGPVLFKGTPFQPVVFTAAFDNSIGLPVGLTDDGSYSAAASCMLRLSAYSNNNQPNGLVKNVVFRHAQSAVEFFGGDYSQRHSLINARFYKCQTAITVYYGSAYVGNALFFDPVAPGASSFCTIYNPSPSSSLLGEHWTVHHAYNLTGGYSAYYDFSLMPTLRNCILADVYQPYAFYSSTDTVITYDPAYFSKAGLGEHYLSDSRAQNVGQYDIDGRLWSEFQNHTTQPPILLSGIVKGGSRFGPRTDIRSDPLVPGYHYPRVDYLVDDLDFDAGEHRILPGTRLAVATSRWFMDNGFLKPPMILWGKDCSVTIGGSKFNEAVLLRDSAIHEKPDTYRDFEISGMAGLTQDEGGLTPKIALNGVKMLDYYGSSPLLGSEWTRLVLSFSATESEFYGVNFGILMCNAWSASFQIDRSVLQGCRLFAMDASQADYTLSFKARNNAFKRTDLLFSPLADNLWELADNIIEECRLVGHGLQQGVPNSQPFPGQHHNAWLNTTDRWTPAQSSDQALASLTWNAGPLGNFYLPQDNEGLIGKGSKTFAQAGLAHYTSNGGQQTPFRLNAAPAVDIGPCFPVVDSFTGKQTDTDGDGIPDNAEDRNGDGIVDWFETDPLNTNSYLEYQSDIQAPEYADEFFDMNGGMTVGQRLKAGLSATGNATPISIAIVDSASASGGDREIHITVTSPWIVLKPTLLIDGDEVATIPPLPQHLSGSFSAVIHSESFNNGWHVASIGGNTYSLSSNLMMPPIWSHSQVFQTSNVLTFGGLLLGGLELAQALSPVVEGTKVKIPFLFEKSGGADFTTTFYNENNSVVGSTDAHGASGANSILWDGKNSAGIVVPFQALKVKIETSWPTKAAVAQNQPGSGQSFVWLLLNATASWPNSEAAWIIRYQGIWDDLANSINGIDNATRRQRIYDAVTRVANNRWHYSAYLSPEPIPPLPPPWYVPGTGIGALQKIPYGITATAPSVTIAFDSVRAFLALNHYRNTWLYTHGQSGDGVFALGGWRDPAPCLPDEYDETSLSAKQIREILHIPISLNQGTPFTAPSQPHRFVYLDGCETAKKTSENEFDTGSRVFAQAFGNFHKATELILENYVANEDGDLFERPKCFIGWRGREPAATASGHLLLPPMILAERFSYLFSQGNISVYDAMNAAREGYGLPINSPLYPGINIDRQEENGPLLIDLPVAQRKKLVDYRWTKTWKALGYGGLTIDNFNQVIGDLR